MKSYPRLTEMGVLHPEQISRYSLSSIDYVDYLRIVYERPKGSLLPTTRTYRFPRVQKSSGRDNSESQGTVVMESCPELLAAVDELKHLVKSKASQQDIVGAMLHELDCFEEELFSRSQRLKALVEKLKKP